MIPTLTLEWTHGSAQYIHVWSATIATPRNYYVCVCVFGILGGGVRREVGMAFVRRPRARFPQYQCRLRLWYRHPARAHTHVYTNTTEHAYIVGTCIYRPLLNCIFRVIWWEDAWPWEPGLGVKTFFAGTQPSPLILYQTDNLWVTVYGSIQCCVPQHWCSRAELKEDLAACSK